MAEESRIRAARGGRRAALAALRALEVLGWTTLFTFAALIIALRYWLLPGIERYREDIVAQFSRAVGLPLKIGSIDAGWQGLRPQIGLRDVRIFDREGREALVLPSIDNVVAWHSLLVLDLRLHSIAIESPKLSVRRDASGALSVAGLPVARDAAAQGGFAAWLLAQREITVRDAEIDWIDEQRGAPPLRLGALQMRVRRSGDAHALGLTARPPAQLGASLELRAEFGPRAGPDAARLGGRVYAELGYTDLAGWRPWVDYPADIQSGQGAVRLWATIDAGAVREATADVALIGARVRLAADLPLLELATVRGRLTGRVLARGYEVGGRDLALAVEGGPALRPLSFKFGWVDSPDGATRSGTFEASLIEIQPLARVARYLPLPVALEQRVAELGLRGELREVNARWSAAAQAAADWQDTLRYEARGRFADLAMDAWRGVPRFAGLAGGFEVTPERGVLALDARNVGVDLPAVFPDPQLRFDALAGRVDWRVTGADRLEARMSSAAFANEHLAGSAFGSYTRAGSGPGLIDLSAQLSRADARHIAKYLPHGALMGEGTRAWLARGIVQGQASDVRLRLYGDLRNFPYADRAAGQFLVTARVEGGVLDYAEGWPRFENIAADLRVERDRIDITASAARVLGVELANVQVAIPGIGSGATRVGVSGEAAGPTGRFLAYIRQSPLRRMLGGATDGFSAAGNGRLRLKLELPIADPAKSRVSGEYSFAGNSVKVAGRLPAVEQASGRLAFSESTFEVDGVKGRVFGGPLAVHGALNPQSGLRIVASGEASARGLAPLVGRPWGEHLSGSTPYVATLTARRGRAEVVVESSLRGMASALPPPLDKDPAATLPLRVTLRPGEGSPPDRVGVALGRLIAAEVLQSGEDEALRRMTIAVNPVAGQALRRLDAPGLLLYGAIPEFDFDRWRPLLLRGDAAAGPQAVLDLEFGKLDAFGKRLNAVALQARAAGGEWSADVHASELAGKLSYLAAGRGTLRARLDHLRIPEDAPGGRPGSLPGEPPAIDLAAERFALRGMQLGRVELLAQPAGADWRIERLAMRNPDAAATLKGEWRVPAAGAAPGARARTSLQFSIEVNDAGKMLERIGHGGLLRGGKAKLEGGLAWNGDPLPLHYASLEGTFSLHAEDGQFLEIEPGLGKLVSLMSLQMLPRRLTLDFRDVFSRGFQFEQITSTLRVKAGVLSTQDFKMLGAAADVAMKGEVDLARETQNLHVRVVPGLGDSACTAAILANPLTGIATCVALKVLDNPLGRIFAYEYAIGGTWTDPKAVKIDLTPRDVPAPGTAPLSGN